MPTVLFLIQHKDMPSSRVRVLNLLPHLTSSGMGCEVMPYPKRWGEKLRMMYKCRQFDIVYLQKKTLTPFETTLLRLSASDLLYDFDDAIYYRHEAHGNPTSRSRLKKFLAIAKKADLLIAGNRILATYAKQYNPHVEILPSAVHVTDTPTKDHGAANGTCVIGWVGGRVNLSQLSLLGPVLQRLAMKHPIELRVLSNESVDMPGVRVTHVPWSLENQESEVAKFDIGVMPLPDSEHAAGKCAYKALQYMAAAVPVVASDVGINGEVVRHNETGLIAESIDEFEPALESLIQDPDRRKRLGQKGRELALKSFSIETVARQLADILHSRS